MNRTATEVEYEEIEETTLGDIFYKYLPYWPFYLLLVIIGLTGAWIYLRYKQPVYQTTATLLIKDDKNSTPASELQDAFDMFGAKKNVENEIEVLQSKTLMQEVVTNLHLYAPVYIAGRVIHQSGYVRSPVIVEAKQPDSLERLNEIHFKINSKKNVVLIHDTAYQISQWQATPYGMLMFKTNPNYHAPKNYQVSVENSPDYFFSLIPVKKAADQISKMVNISPSSKESTVIDLSIESTVPKEGEDILNELLKVYKEASILDKNQLAANTLKFVNARLAIVSNDLDSVENALQNFKAKNKITDISAQGQIYLQTVATNDQQISDINVQLAMLDQVEQYVKGKGDLGGIVPASIGQTDSDPILTSLLQKLSDLELQYTQMKKVVPENNPSLAAVADGIDKLKPQILDNIVSQRNNLLAAKRDLTSTSNQYGSMLTSIPEKERELLTITRQQAIKNNIYTFLLQKKEETALSFASAVADSRVLDNAQTSDSPVSPKKKLIYLAALLGSLFLGFVIIYLKDLLNRSVQDRADVEKYTHIPFLGEVGYEKSKTPFVISEGKRTYIAEQFRQIRTALGYLGVGADHKKILVTSSISGEGKSFMTINLGISLALTGKKVVILELDLRKPKLSEQFGISRRSGLSNYLIDKLTPGELVQKTTFENMFLIPSGPIPPNPSELISNGRLRELLKDLEEKFDYILMDTAPITPVTDANIISPMADVTLFIVRHDYTPRVLVQNLERQHKIDALKNPAIVYNGIKGRGVQRYGYGYGYGYAEDEKTWGWWKRILKGF
jgi:capsular exopolysaccharide synthesis family protein